MSGDERQMEEASEWRIPVTVPRLWERRCEGEREEETGEMEEALLYGTAAYGRPETGAELMKNVSTLWRRANGSGYGGGLTGNMNGGGIVLVFLHDVVSSPARSGTSQSASVSMN